MKTSNNRLNFSSFNNYSWIVKWINLKSICLLSMAQFTLELRSDEGELTATDISAIKAESANAMGKLPDPVNEIAKVPARYGKVPVRFTHVITNECSNPPEDPRFRIDDLLSWELVVQEESLAEGETVVHQLEVGKVYIVDAYSMFMDIHVEPGYQVVVDGRATKGMTGFSAPCSDGFPGEHVLQIVPDRGQLPFGESKGAQLDELFSWTLSMGESYAGAREYSIGQSPKSPFWSLSDDYEGELFSSSHPIGYIDVWLPLKDLEKSDFLNHFESYYSAINIPTLMLIFMEREGRLGYECPEPPDCEFFEETLTFYHGLSSANYEYAIILQNHFDASSEPDGFDITIELENGDPYREYTFRIDQASASVTITTKRGGNLLRTEVLSYSDVTGEWTLAVKDSTSNDLKVTSVIYADLSSSSWQAEISTSGVVSGSLKQSSKERKSFEILEFESTYIGYSQNRLVEYSTFDISGAGGTEWSTDFVYYDAVDGADKPLVPTTYSQLKSIQDPGGAWELYVYHEESGYVTASPKNRSWFGKAGRLYKKYEPFMNFPASSPQTLNDTVGRVTMFYYDLTEIRSKAFNDFVNGKTVYCDGVLVEHMEGESSPYVDERGNYSLYQFFVDSAGPSGTVIESYPVRVSSGKSSFKSTVNIGTLNLEMEYEYSRPDPDVSWALGTHSIPDHDTNWNPSSFTGLSDTPYFARAVVRGRKPSGYSSFECAGGLPKPLHPRYQNAVLVANESTLERTYFNLFSEIVRTEKFVWTGSAWDLLSWENYTYVDHRLTEIRNSKNLLEIRQYYPATSPFYGQLYKKTDFEGVITEFSYDCLNRVIQKSVGQSQVMVGSEIHTIPPKTDKIVYDGNGRPLIYKTNNELTEVRRYDLAGHMVCNLNGDGDGIWVQYSRLDERIVTETKVWGQSNWSNIWDTGDSNFLSLLVYPGISDRRTVITEKYRDGSLNTRSGTSVTFEKHVYAAGNGIDTDANTCIIKTITLGINPQKQIVSRKGIDRLGRPTFTDKASISGDGVIRTSFLYEHDFEYLGDDSWYEFDICGHHISELDHEGGSGQVSRKVVEWVTGTSAQKMMADTLYKYDLLGRLVEETLDAQVDESDSGFTDSVSQRIRTYGYSYVESPANTWWWETTTSALLRDDSETNEVMVGRQRERLSGFTVQSGYALASETQTWEIGADTAIAAATLSKTEIDRTAHISLQTVTQPGGRTMKVYNSHGLPLVEEEPGGSSKWQAYDNQWRLSRVWDPRNTPAVLLADRVYATNGGGKLSQILAPTDSDGTLGTVKAFTYESGNSGGRLQSETDALGNTTYYDYNTRDLVLHKWGTKVNPVAYSYDDDFGWRETMTTYREPALSGSFDSSMWPSSPGIGDVTTWSYDPNTGRLISRKDAKNQTTYYGYDGFNRLNARLLPNGNLKRMAFNGDTGELFSRKYYKNATSVLDTSQPDGATPSVFYAYNRLGMIEQVKDGTGTRVFSYEDASEPSAKGLLHGETLNLYGNSYVVEFDYDSARRRLEELKHGISTATHSMAFAYRGSSPAIGLLDQITATGGSGEPSQTFSYTYKTDTSWVETMVAGGLTHTRGYENKRNVVASTGSTWNAATDLGLVTYIRDELGRIAQLDRENGMYRLYNGVGIGQRFGYTSEGELESAVTESLATPGTALPGRWLTVSYDGQGNRDWMRVDGELSHDYTPGPANEYSAVTHGEHTGWIMGAGEEPGQVVAGGELAERAGAYFYRGYGAESSPSWTLEDIYAAAEPPPGQFADAYAADRKAVHLPAATASPSYDAAGNLLSDGRWTYVYDGENRLIGQTSAAHYPGETYALRLDFAYDYRGRRVRKTVSANGGATLSDTAFTYWEWQLLSEIDLTTDALLRHYAWGLDKEGMRPGAGGVGGLLMVVDDAHNKTYFALNDYLGNVTGLFDPDTAETVAEYEYDPFGRELRATGPYAHDNPIRFSSQYWDEETDLVYFGFRYYHPQWGRFLNRDPIEEAGGVNLYRFVSNDPVNRWDLLGLGVVAASADSQNAILNTLRKDDRASVAFDDDGRINVELFNKSESDSGNYSALSQLVNDDDRDFVVSVSDSYTYRNENGDLVEHKMGPVTQTENREGGFGLNTGEEGELGQTLLPGEAGIPRSSPDESIGLVINSGLSEEGRAQLFAHEAYGHANLYSEGKDPDHNPKFVFCGGEPSANGEFPPPRLVEQNKELADAISSGIAETIDNMNEAEKE